MFSVVTFYLKVVFYLFFSHRRPPLSWSETKFSLVVTWKNDVCRSFVRRLSRIFSFEGQTQRFIYLYPWIGDDLVLVEAFNILKMQKKKKKKKKKKRKGGKGRERERRSFFWNHCEAEQVAWTVVEEVLLAVAIFLRWVLGGKDGCMWVWCSWLRPMLSLVQVNFGKGSKFVVKNQLAKVLFGLGGLAW